jgi:hypothetical protein
VAGRVCDNQSMRALEQRVPDASHSEVGGLVIDEVEAGKGRIKRVIYPPGWSWTAHMQPVTGGERCMHAHVGFLVQGRMMVEYADGCREAYQAPAAVVVAPGHVGWVEGDEAAVLVQYDCGADTVDVLGVAAEHRHDA